jgi:hypothetical protein
MLIITMTKQTKNKNLSSKHALELLITLFDMENEKGKGSKKGDSTFATPFFFNIKFISLIL